ncbi:DNA-directed RNA polymerase III subunit RPC5 [Ipomoea triloba]|uniref:DNA-directed RNA polymerase III subunit RPC5 n=1 Tax=Ipomoea triloba TaxID=35885 RepID=UPI00125D364C|nr:DNA-directed RNA polymerase III subunit RPC5 [Ipomoea triloba]
MADLDLEDLDAAPTKPQARPGRFAPKGSRAKPQPSKLKTEPVSTSDSVLPEPYPVPVAKKEELDSKPVIINNIPESKPEEDDRSANDVALMDVDAKPENGDDELLDNEPMDTEGGEDEVVREIDVYLTPSIDHDTKLYVMQYPLRPIWRPYEMEERCEEVRVKTSSSEVEVDLSIDFDSKNYDRNADYPMTKQSLLTKWKPTPLATGYAVGVLVGNKLHLNPIHAVVQLRPSMEHHKPGGPKKTNIQTSAAENPVKIEEAKEQKPPVPSKKQNKPMGKLQDKDIEESWVCLKYHGAQSDVSSRCFRKMVEAEGSPVKFSMSPDDYVNVLCPGALTGGDKVKAPPIRSLILLPLEERFKTWLTEGPPIHRFDTLKHLAPEESAEEILGVLQKHAVLVQGLWVPKSSLVCKKDKPVELVARDYVLSLFSKAPSIKNSVFKDKAVALDRAMKDVLNVLAVERPILNDWKLKEKPDTKFLKLYPHIVKEQAEKWELLERSMLDVISKGSSKRQAKHSSENTVTKKSPASTIPDKQGPKTTNGSQSRTPMSEETREALPKALLKLFKVHKVCSFQQICQRLREMAVSESARPKGNAREATAAAMGVDAPPEELQAIINQVAVNIHGVYVLKSSPDFPQYDALRKVVIALLIAEGPNAKLKRASVIEAARLQLNKDITDTEFQKVVSELCVSQSSGWVLKRGDGSPK